MSTSKRVPIESLLRLREEGVVKEASRHYVVDDLEPLGEVVGPRYEIIDGDLYMSPSPHFRHQEIVLRFAQLLADALHDRGGRLLISPVDVVLADDVLVVPDLLAVSPAKWSRIKQSEGGQIREVPDLVIEVRSPGTAWYDRTVKKDLYERSRIPEYWIVDADERRVHQLRLGDTGYEETVLAGPAAMLESDLLGEAAIEVEDIFATT